MGLSILLFVIAILPSILLADVVWFVVNLLTPPNGRDMYEQANALLPNHNITVPIGLGIAVGVSLLYDFYQTRKSTRKKLISIQYEKIQASSARNAAATALHSAARAMIEKKRTDTGT